MTQAFIYEITALVPTEMTEEYEKYMRERHIPDLLATGYFRFAYFTRSAGNRFRVQYHARSQSALDEYLQIKAESLRADFLAHFPDGVEITREVWEVLQSWEKDFSNDE